jgi:undecaprenyl-diphosphatase
MPLTYILILALVQGLAELLPVSSSAHVIIAEKLLPEINGHKINPSSPEMTLLLAMLHTGTMFAVIVYFWKAWKASIFASKDVFQQQAVRLVLASALTAAIYLPLGFVLKKAFHVSEIEELFSNLALVSGGLAAAGILILWAGLSKRAAAADCPLGMFEAACIGAVQGVVLPFRGFSRSGATISVGMLLGCAKVKVEEFSFALAVILTPALICQEVYRLYKSVHHDGGHLSSLSSSVVPSLIGMVAAFFAGLLALRWLSGWLEHGRWYLFGIYCLVASAFVLGMHLGGY